MFFYNITPQSIKKYKEKSVFFSKPKLVAFYDYNYGKITTAKRMNYFQNLKSNIYPINLNDGFEKYIPRESAMYSRNIDLSLKYDMSVAGERDSVENMEKTKVITRRGTLVYIMQSYYCKKYSDELIIRVSRYNGHIYMVLEEEDESTHKLIPYQTHHSRLEKLLFTDSPGKPPNLDEPYDENIELVGVHRSNFGKYDIIYSGEIQGIISQDEIKDFDDLEALNDCRFVFSKQMWKKYKNDNKYLKFWLQAYLANVQDLYIGYKIKDNIIEEPLEHKVAGDIPNNVYWKPSVCTGFLYDFLQHVEKLMSSVDCLKTVYVFYYNRDEKSFNYEIFSGETDKTFITKEYMNYCDKNFKN
ncbi:decapping nuclease DXO homolog [Lucilia sericata]|uniref:decapping nuclease DXO homolog n=1 Tax=Lucilia sericata TaxID=13632 RepID=UPI0018A811EB|nr:decapping nuclease DXO homolog [Lucilia sericata]